ncbi:MAG: MFS transporter [Thiolinea sp.]
MQQTNSESPVPSVNPSNNSPFSYPTFRRLFAAQLTALVGSGFTQMALALLAFDLAGAEAAIVLGIAWTMRVTASVIFAPIFGGLVHLLPRKYWLIGLDVGRALIVLFLPFVTTAWQIYLLIFLLNILSAGFTPVFQALLPDVLKDEAVYTRALSWSRLAFELERILSPVFAGFALLLISYNALFVFNALSFLISALLLFTTTFPQATPSQRSGGILHNISYGIQAYWKTPRLRALLGLHLAVAATGSMVIINTVGHVQGTLGLTEQVTVWMMAVSGGGAIVAARLTPWLLENYLSDRRLMLRAGGLLALSLLPAIVFNVGLPLLALTWFVIGLGSSFILTAAGRILTRSCRKADRNAFFAANFALSHAAWLLCYPLAGWLGAEDFSTAAFVLGLLALAGVLFARWVWQPGDVEELWHEHEALEHEHPHYHDEHHQHEHENWDGVEPHVHSHAHGKIRHKHRFVIDEHHARWPGIGR